MIYALEANGRTLALTDDPDAATKLNINVFTRWVTPAEAARFRTLQAAEQRKRWPVLRWLWWLWPAAPC